MLVVISDLHFVDETAGQHNLPVDAFQEVFLSDVVELAIHKRAKEIVLLLLGDIPDLIRSAQWFNAPLAERPWGEQGLADVQHWQELGDRPPTPTAQTCLRILGQMPESGHKEDVPENTILYTNWETMALFRELETETHRLIEEKNHHLPPEQRLTEMPPVQLVYVPGNHDRMVNLYPSVRDAWQEMAGITITPQTVDGDPEGEWWFRYDYRHHDYGVHARHGHQFDPWNYGGGHDLNSREAHLELPLGDVIATEFAVGLVWQAQQRRDELSQELMERLQDVDNVRPISRLLEWLYYEIEHHAAYRDELDAIADAVTKNILEIPFVRRWRSPLSNLDERLRMMRGLSGVADWLERLGPPGPDELMRLAATAPTRWMLDKMIDLTNANTLLQFLLFFLGKQGRHGPDEADPFLQAAFREHVWRLYPEIHMILYGHTHQPGAWPLEANPEREVIYVNTGTWRERIQRTVALDTEADFMTLKQMTYVVIYGSEENGGWEGGNKRPSTPSFDMWTGAKLKHYR